MPKKNECGLFIAVAWRKEKNEFRENRSYSNAFLLFLFVRIHSVPMNYNKVYS